ncbi:MAG: putative Sugar-specific transcriptional regulator TrmB [Promethearchaeota archaeon]|jgi:predicted transcriptional regulator|nr:MAG: putative Sugar-specific transcriptional regulator TrmB [Candidatus Lokiarchaeota archaeon]
MKTEKEQEFIQAFQETGLNESESKVYYRLIKEGSKGAIVKDLNKEFPDLARTTIYSIIRKLEEYGYVEEAGVSSRSKGATLFAAINPVKFFRKIISKKEEELEKLNELSMLYSDRLEYIYNEGISYSLKDTDPRLYPYIAPLLKKKWKLTSYIEEKKTSTINYDFFELTLQSPLQNFYGDVGLLLFLFEYNVEKDEVTLNFFRNMIQRKAKEELIYKIDITGIDSVPIEIELLERKFQGYELKAKLEELAKSDIFADKLKYMMKNPQLENKGSLTLGLSLMIPIERKIFVLWGESKERFKEIIKIILEREKK